MSRARFFPYRTAPEAISMEIHYDSDVFRSGVAHSLNLAATPYETIDLDISLHIADETLTSLVPDHEREGPPVDTMLIISSSDSRQRMAQKMCNGQHAATRVSISREHWSGTLKFEAVLVRSVSSDEMSSGFAFDRGSRLAWSDPIAVHLDNPREMPGSHIPLKWLSFSENPRREWTRPYSDYLFHLDTTGELPTILLNSDIQGAMEYLDSGGTHGPKARVRDSVNATITHQVWTSLLGIALDAVSDSVEPDSHSIDSEVILSQIQDWQSMALSDWAPHIYPEYDYPEALESLLRDSTRIDSRTHLLAELIPSAIQRRFSTISGLTGFVTDRYQ